MPLDVVIARWNVGDWWEAHGWAILWSIIIAAVAMVIVRRTVHHVVRPALKRQMPGSPEEEIKRRSDTLSGVINGTAKFIIITLATLTILPELGIDMRALLAGVSISSIALGFGAQSLVRDGLNGIFILSENQYVVGDTITVAGVTGTVEDITLRRTMVRDVDGTLHTVPNGAIATTANHTRDFAKVRVIIPVAHASDLEKVKEVANRIGNEMAADPAFKDIIITAPQYLRIDNIDMMGGVAVNVNGTVVPGRQWEIAGAMRARLLDAFQKEGIKTPWG
jgi:small conductance mechanosensitive channel